MGCRNKNRLAVVVALIALFLASSVLAVDLRGRSLLDSDDHDHDHDHDHEVGKEKGSVELKGDSHDHESESAAEHIVEDFGGEGVLYETEVAMLFDKLNDGCGAGSKGGHDHGHDHGHGHDEKGKETLTAEMLLEDFGHDGKLHSQDLDEACSSILRCQLEPGCELVSEEHHDDDDDENEGVGTLKLIIAIVFFIEAILGTVIVLVTGYSGKFKTALGVMNSFAGGVFLATGFIHLLPHINENEAKISGLNEYPLGYLIIVIGFMLVFFVEHVLFDVHNSMDNVFKDEITDMEKKGIESKHPTSDAQVLAVVPPEHKSSEWTWSKVQKPVVLLAAISVHAILEAIAVGLETQKSDVLLLFASIGSHKGVAALALTARFINNGASRKQALVFMSAFALIAPFGILIGWASDSVEPMTLLILDGLAAGTFIYVGAYEVIAEEFHHHEDRREVKFVKYLAVAVGTTMISLLQLVPHADH
ncbi:hypothetical protein BSKO_13834 [Bryopsis sp. KO-2023]|nr:hypothetical protein BSKO_13834 [Bryopsis sp. KO-2023]